MDLRSVGVDRTGSPQGALHSLNGPIALPNVCF